MSNQTHTRAHLAPPAEESIKARNINADRADSRAIGLDPRRARMVRELEAVGFEWRAVFEAGRLAAAAALGAILTFGLIGHPPSSANMRAAPAPHASAPAASPEERGAPQLLAPLDAPPVAATETPQRDVHSDGGGH